MDRRRPTPRPPLYPTRAPALTFHGFFTMQRRLWLLIAGVALAARPAAAVDFVVTNCATINVGIATYSDNDTLFGWPAFTVTIGPNRTEPVRCATQRCYVAYTVGTNTVRRADTFATDLCLTGETQWDGRFQGYLHERNCSEQCR